MGGQQATGESDAGTWVWPLALASGNDKAFRHLAIQGRLKLKEKPLKNLSFCVFYNIFFKINQKIYKYLLRFCI